MRHGDHDISLLVPSLDVLEGFGYSLQRETLIDNRLELAGRDKVGDEAHSCRVLHGHAAFQFWSPTMDVHKIPTMPVTLIMF